jgi:hypothetical protein
LAFAVVTLYIWMQQVRLIMKTGRINYKLLSILLYILMLTFSSCAEADICWTCVNPNDPSDIFDVCSAVTKNKWESYGYNCN